MRIHVLLPLLLAACGGNSPPPERPGSRGLRAVEHVEAAHREDERAHDRAMWPDTRTEDGTGRTDQLLIGTPFHRTWDTAAEHERLAAIHRSMAAQIYKEYEDACGARSSSEIAISPLVRYGIGGSPTADGVLLYLSPEAGSPEQLLAEMRCHRAWMMLGPTEMDDCPLDLAGLIVDATGSKEGITLKMTVRDRKLIPELQRRAAHDLELGSTLREAGKTAH